MTTEDPTPVVCVVCGSQLGADPEDDPDSDGTDLPICGECNRARNFDALLWELDAADD